MIPREVIGIAEVPGGRPLRLVRHDGDFIIMLERNELMSSRMSGSEVALGVMTCRRLRSRETARVLIGGYGMGFTLRAVQAELGPSAEIVVAELVSEIIDWARGPLQHLTGTCLDDPRLRIVMGDVGDTIDAGTRYYDAILLDVDNGPDGATRPGNDALYSPAGLKGAHSALRPGGILAIWSAASDKQFTRRLQVAGFLVDEVQVPARQNGKGPKHTIWFATVR